MATTNSGVTTALPKLRVLVVDDNEDGAEAICALLATMGCITASACNGAQGIATAAAFQPHLALIDLEMPDISGCDVARHLRGASVRCSARLICLTGHGQPEDRCLCLGAGFDDFFTKPMRPESLAALVTEETAALHSSGLEAARC